MRMTLGERLPPFYTKDRATRRLLEEMQRVLEEMEGARGDILDQLDLAKATWGLAVWESALGLEGGSGDAAYRREHIMAHLRGSGTCTVALIIDMAKSFTNGTVAVEEFPRESRIALRFTDIIGVPSNLEGLSEALNRTLPAHVAYEYIFLYTTWEMYQLETWDSESGEQWNTN